MQNSAKISAYDKENIIKEFMANNILALSEFTGIDIHVADDVNTAIDIADDLIANMSDKNLSALCADVLRVQVDQSYNVNWQARRK